MLGFRRLRSKAHENLHKLSPVLHNTLERLAMMPYREFKTPEELKSALQGVDRLIIDSIVVFWRVTDELSSRHGGLLLSKQRGKEIFRLLPELETLVCVEDQRLHECLGLLTTRFPNGFDGQASFRQ